MILSWTLFPGAVNNKKYLKRKGTRERSLFHSSCMFPHVIVFGHEVAQTDTFVRFKKCK
jgi:hypothetical protein